MCTSCSCSTAGPQIIEITTASAPAWSETFTLTGVTCGGCAGRVSEAVAQITGIDRVEIDVAVSVLTVHGANPVERARITAAVEAAGYGLI